MQLPPHLKQQLVREIASAASPAEAMRLFSEYREWVADYKFVFAAPSGSSMGLAAHRQFAGGGAVRSLFNSERVVVLDVETFDEMRKGQATFRIDYSISLDTMAMSYLEPHIKGRASKVPEMFVEVFEFIARDEVWVDPMPYVLENQGSGNFGDERKAERIFEKLKAYEILRSLDTSWLRAKGEAQSIFSEAELVKKAQQTMAGLLIDVGNEPAMRALKFKHDYLYANLLQLALIQLRHRAWSVEQKVEAYLDFCHDQLATVNLREAIIGRRYFEIGHRLKFFGRVQTNRTDLLECLRNMAWDIFHLRYLESTMAATPKTSARYFFPALLTFDADLVEVIDLCPLRSMAFNRNLKDMLPVYEAGSTELLFPTAERQSAAESRYFSVHAAADRDTRRASASERLTSTVVGLEDELQRVASKA